MDHANFAKQKSKAYGFSIIIFILLITLQTVIADTSSNGLKLTVYLSNITYVGTTYTSLFKIENLDHVSGTTDHINLTIGYNITLNNSIIKQDSLLVTDLNSYKTSNTGLFTPNKPGNYTITGWIISSTVIDTNKNDDITSKIIESIDTSVTQCNIFINITTDKLIYDESESVKFSNELNNESYPFVIEYWIEDFFGKIYKSKYNTTNTDQKSWKTDIDEQDRILFIKSVLYPKCNDLNLSDNYFEKMFIVKSNNTSSEESADPAETSSKIEIVDVDEKAEFGSIIPVKIEAYRGNTGKYSISLYAEKNTKKASEITKITVSDKYSFYKGQIPLQLKPNCDLKLEDGRYDIILEGLGEEDKQKITIEGIKKSLCPEESKTESTKESKECPEQKQSDSVKYTSEKPKNLAEYNLINQLLCTDSIHYKKTIYESKNEEIKKMIPYFIIALTTLIAIVLIWKR